MDVSRSNSLPIANKACRRCRARKIKCNGQRPTCATCQSAPSQCLYDVDRRRTSRTSMKEGFQQVDKKIAHLERQLARLRQPAMQCEIDTHLQSHATSPQVPSPIDSNPADPLPSNETGESQRGVGILSTQCSPSVSDAVSTNIHALVQTESGASVYGPASVLHVPPLTNAASGRPRAGSEVSRSYSKQQRNPTDQFRQQLFAYSALEFQKEHANMLERKYDLDGVDWETANHLLDIHWNLHHLGFLMTYRPAIMDSLATDGPHCNKLLLNAIYYSSALQSARPNMQDDPAYPDCYGTKFFERFMSLMPMYLHSSSTTSIAAFATMGSACVSHGRQAVGWLLAGIAYRMIIDLGLHVDPEKIQISSLVPGEPQICKTAIEIEIQRRYVWACYMLDRFQSLYFGRPPALSMPDGLEPPDAVLDTYEELETWKPYIDPAVPQKIPAFIPQPARATSTRHALLGMAKISSQITDRFYGPQACKLSAGAALSEVQRVQHLLDRWKDDLPQNLRYTVGDSVVPPPFRFNMHMLFSLLHILLYRPFLQDGHLEALNIDEADHRSICVDAAQQIYLLARTYRDTFTLRGATYLFSYAVFSAATIIPLHMSPGSRDNSQMDIVVFFWNALKELQNGANFGFRKPIMIIKRMFERSGIDFMTMASTQRGDHSPTGRSSNQERQEESLPLLPDSGMDIQLDDLYHDILDNVEWPDFMEDVDTTATSDPLFGLFRSSGEGDLVGERLSHLSRGTSPLASLF